MWLAILERALKTFAQALGAVVVAGGATTATGVDWVNALDVALLAGLLSLITSAVSLRVGRDGPSLANEEIDKSW